MFYLNSTLNFWIPSVLVFQLEVCSMVFIKKNISTYKHFSLVHYISLKIWISNLTLYLSQFGTCLSFSLGLKWVRIRVKATKFSVNIQIAYDPRVANCSVDVYEVFDEIHVDETIKCYVNVRSMSLKDVVANIFIIMRLDVQLFNGKFI